MRFRKPPPRKEIWATPVETDNCTSIKNSQKKGGREIRKILPMFPNSVIFVSTGHLRGELQDAYDQLKQCQHPAHRSRRQTAFSNKKRSLHTGIRLENFTKETTGNKGKSAFDSWILRPSVNHAVGRGSWEIYSSPFACTSCKGD
jgi:hypothetical protein